MNKHLITLEYPKILERLARYCTFSGSKELALALTPSPYPADVQARQAETTEACKLLAARPNTGIGQVFDVRPFTERARRGITLLPEDLLRVRQTLVSAREVQRLLERLAQPYPHLADTAGRIEPCPGLINDIGNALDERGEIKNSASPALAQIRREMEIAHSRLMDKLNRILTSSQYGPILQEALITQRSGRYVLPVKADFKGRMPGVVHDQSGSGVTVFVEPLVTVELNNRLRQLQSDEADEIQRILAELSAGVGQNHRLINHTVAALAELDLALAKAKYAEALDAVEPVLVLTAENGADIRFDLRAARHPLLNPDSVVPVDVALPPGARMLVITGPNTGGKTVSLKTVGLLAAMAQAGLRLPAADGSTLPVFRHILADIGDEQSIEQSLSTFSGHMTNIVQILNTCDAQSLVVLDELGAGTDPVEGAALAGAILHWLLARHVTTFVATHYAELKAFAHTTPGVANASMAFDVDTLAPTFKLQLGLPGASNAFAIAHRLGMPPQIIDRARSLVAEEAQQIEALLAEINAERAGVAALRREAEAERAKAAAGVAEQAQRLAEAEAEGREILNSARADARREIKAVREEIRALRAQAQAQAEALLEAARAAGQPEPETPPAADEMVDIDERLDALAAAAAPQTPPPVRVNLPAEAKLSGPVRVGDKVLVQQFGTLGEVISVQNGQVEVQLGRFRTTVPLAAVELRERAAQVADTAPRYAEPEVESPGLELDLRGQVTEEALINLDRYLDQAFMARLPWVRIIHGRGSGALRRVVRDELQRHPLVSSYQAGDENEGGEGVTVAKLVQG